jgi:integrase
LKEVILTNLLLSWVNCKFVPLSVGKSECIILRPIITKGDEPRTVPLHDHLLEQDLLDYVEDRRKLGKPLFYDPARSRGGQAANPHYKKVGQRIAEWVGDLNVDHAIAPNHGWGHRWQSIARHVRMHQQIANFLVGHGDKDVSSTYGEKWTKTLYKEIMLIPKYEIPGLLQAPPPHRRRVRRVAKLETA